MRYHFTVPRAYDHKKLALFLKNGCALSSALIRSVKYLEYGLLVDGIRAKTNQLLRAGQTVTLSLPKKDTGLSASDIVIPIAYEDDNILVYDKPSGIAVHPTLNYQDDTLANVYAAYARKLGTDAVFRPINRLDKNTSGLVLAAKTRYAAPLLAKTAQKKYLALCEGTITQDYGVINAPIGRSDTSIIRHAVCGGGSPSITQYTVLARSNAYTFLEVLTQTGRTHQIRVHFSHIGHPLLGDDLYGGNTNRIRRHALHCCELSFEQLFTGDRVVLNSPLPADMAVLCQEIPVQNKAKILTL